MTSDACASSGEPALLYAVQRRLRADLFVGRCGELAAFAGLLDTRTPRIVFVHGPGGMGKTSLLGGFGEVAAQAKCRFSRLDARQLAPSPPAIASVVHAAVGELSSTHGRPGVLAIDHCETLAALDGWLREELLPSLPADLILVLASRSRPGANWRADPGISDLLIEVPLKPLNHDAVADYLVRRGVIGAQAQAIEHFARGTPLALALAADQVVRDPDRPFDIGQLPDLVQTFVQWLLGAVDAPAKLLALQACATARRLDEPLLAAMLDATDVTREFDWLAGQYFTEFQTRGLVIHDLVRDVVVHDLRSRNIARHHSLIRRAIAHMLTGADTSRTDFRVKTVPDIIYTLRHEPHIREHLGFGEIRCYTDTPRSGDREIVAAEIERLEGPTSRRWFEYWLESDRSEWVVLRDAGERPVAFALLLRLELGDMQSMADDPALAALKNALDAGAPLRGHERVLLARHRMACATHQALTPAWAELSAHLNGRMFTPGISLLASSADLRYQWSGMDDNADYHLLPDSEYRIDDRAFMISAHDLRCEPALDWAHNSVERVLRGGQAPELKPDPVELLHKADFTAAVRRALADYCDGSALEANPLLRSAMLRRYSGERSCETLRALIAETGEQLAPTSQRILRAAFFSASGLKRQAIATDLCMSERGLRRHLRAAETELIDTLWQRETRP